MKRRSYLKKLYKLTCKYGKENIVYFDESGFKSNIGHLDGWAQRGKKIYADIKGKREKRTNLLMAQCGKKWLAPLVFQGSCTAKLVEEWLEKFLMKELDNPVLL